MKIKTLFILFISIILFFQTQSALAAHPAKDRANLYVFFDNRMVKQKLTVQLSKNGKENKIVCSISKSKKTVPNKDHPACGFGFHKSSATIQQINYQVGKEAAVPICSELNGKEFSHGKLTIFSDSSPAHCNFEETK